MNKKVLMESINSETSKTNFQKFGFFVRNFMDSSGILESTNQFFKLKQT